MKPHTVKIAHSTIDGLPVVELHTDSLRLAASLDFGPRILDFGPVGRENLLYRLNNEEGLGPHGRFFLRGGHRLWHAPEHPERTYSPDNDAVEKRLLHDGRGFSLCAPQEPETHAQKIITIEAVGERIIRLTHEIVNRGLWPVELAPWALTIMPPTGVAVIPLPPKGEHPRDLLPSWHLVPWDYTDLSAPCWRIERNHILFLGAAATSPQKLGIAGHPGWIACWREGDLFIKAAAAAPGVYPDRGSSAEIFGNGKILELETLAPLKRLDPGESAIHIEHWTAITGIPSPLKQDDFSDAALPAIGNWLDEIASLA